MRPRLAARGDLFARVLGRTVRTYRQLRKIPLRVMCRAMGFKSASGWSRVETGDTPMTVAHLCVAARYLGMPAAEIVRAAEATMPPEEKKS